MENEKLLKLGLRLEYATLGWNVFECGFVLAAAAASASVALLGFGIDSIIEIFASIVVVWQLKLVNKRTEHIAERLIGASFLLVALYILLQSLHSFFVHARPQASPLGVVVLFLTVIVMFVLSYKKANVGRKLGNKILRKEAKVTLMDGMLALSVLIGILLNTFFGWWWADPLAGLIIVYYGFQEGIHMIKNW